MIELLISSVIIINSFTAGGSPAVGGAGSILQEDGISKIQQQDAFNLLKEFAGTGNLLQQDGTFLFQQDGTKIQQQ